MAPPDTYLQKAQQGESLRLVGNYSAAIRYFTEAITEYAQARGERRYSWAYAHRAAARGALGDFGNALKDFREAAGFYSSYNPAWHHAQVGELYRLWARAVFTHRGVGPTEEEWSLIRSTVGHSGDGVWLEYLPPDSGSPSSIKDPLELMHHAIISFTGAIELRGAEPWVLAHRAATYTMRYCIGLPETRFGLRGGHEKDFEQGDRDYKAACEYNPSYGWAYAFHAVLLAAQGHRHEEVMALLGRAGLSGMDRQVTMLLTLLQLSGATKVTSRPQLELLVQRAWDLLQVDGDEAYARYYVATGLQRLKEHGPFVTDDVSRAAMKRAKVAVQGLKGQVFAMEGGLACLQRDFKMARDRLEAITQIRAHHGCDLETLGVIARDVAWLDVREGRPPPGLQPDQLPDFLQAHELFRKLFAF